MKIYQYGVGHMTKMAALPIYGKNPSNTFFSITGGPISMNFGMYTQAHHRFFSQMMTLGLTMTCFRAMSKFVT